MTDPVDFLRAIVAAPDDTATRLVFADWLEEAGDLPRASLIRAQCELASLPRWDRRAIEATWEVEQLLARHGARWRAELPVLDGIAWTDFERGFVSTVRARDVTALHAHAAAIAAAAPVSCVELATIDETETPWSRPRVPWLKTLRITSSDVAHTLHPKDSIVDAPDALELVDLGEYERLEWLAGHTATLSRLTVEGVHVVGQGFARQLAAAPPAGLTHLALGTRFVDWDSGYYDDPTLGIAGAHTLAAAGLGRLVALDLRRQRVRAEGLAAMLQTMPLLRELGARAIELDDLAWLAASPRGTPLVRLELGQNAIGDAGARAIASAPRLAALESLELDTCEISAAGVTALTAAPCWQTLRYLDLKRNPIGLAGVLALTEAAVPARLHTLRIADADLAEDAARLFAAIPWLRGLLVLELSANDLAEVGEALAQLATSTVLRQLSVAQTGLGPIGARALAPLWEQLVQLDASTNALAGAGLGALITDRPSVLQVLQLRGCAIDAAGLEVLLARARCPQLRSLDLGRNALDAPALERLLTSPLGRQLETLDLSTCTLTDDAADVLARIPMPANLRALDLRDNAFSVDALVRLATAPALHAIPTIRLSGAPWTYAAASRELLAARFGPTWNYELDNLEEERPE